MLEALSKTGGAWLSSQADLGASHSAQNNLALPMRTPTPPSHALIRSRGAQPSGCHTPLLDDGPSYLHKLSFLCMKNLYLVIHISMGLGHSSYTLGYNPIQLYSVAQGAPGLASGSSVSRTHPMVSPRPSSTSSLGIASCTFPAPALELAVSPKSSGSSECKMELETKIWGQVCSLLLGCHCF